MYMSDFYGIFIQIFKMDGRSNQKKLVDAFRTFFEKSISPYVYSNQSVMNEWKYFSRLISSQPIDYGQVQFYILLANKSQFTPQLQQQQQSQLRNTTYAGTRYGQMPIQSQNQKMATDSDKKSSNSKNISSPKKKNLVACLQMFQNMLIKNQEKLQSFNGRKDISITSNNTNMGGVNPSKRYYD